MPELRTRPVAALPTATSVANYLHALVAGRGNISTARVIADGFKHTPTVRTAFDLVIEGKAAIGAGTTSDAQWASPLVATGIADEAIAVLRGLSIVGALADGKLRRVPFATKVPRDDSATVIGAWVDESKPIPVAALSFANVGPLSATKVATIVVLTKEVVVAGTPSTNAIVVRSVLGGLAAMLDQSFLLPTSVAAPGKPAAVTVGATEVPSTGATAAAMTADLSAMLAAITTAGGKLVWVMRPTTMAHIAGALGSTSGLPGTLFGLPVIASKNSPPQVTLLDGDGIVYADEGEFDVSLSGEANVIMDAAPVETAAAVVTSLFQANLVGIRAIRTINWLRAVNGSVAFMTVTY